MKSLRSFLLLNLHLLPVLSFAACSSDPKASDVKEIVASEPAAAAPAKTLPTDVSGALSSPFRTESNKERDIYRHPKETLDFFGLTPEMHVVEISPGGGWYSEILAPLLSSKGEFIAAVPAPGASEYLKKSEAAYKEWVAKNPELKVSIVPFDLAAPAPLVVTQPVDMVLTFRNVHNWMGQDKAQAVFNSFFSALKPGGVLGVVEHRGDAKKPQDPKGKTGYVKESEVIRWATKAGFKLDKKSEINANPKDTKDYADGVWTLPPSFKKGEVDRDKYAAIGESDRMTLRFIKPEPKAKAKAKAKK